MIQKFIVTIDSNEKISSKEIADALNYSTGSFSLSDNHDDIISAKVRKVNEVKIKKSSNWD